MALSTSGVGYSSSAEGSGGSFFQLYWPEDRLQATVRRALAGEGSEARAGSEPQSGSQSGSGAGSGAGSGSGLGLADRAEASEWAQRALQHAEQSKGPLSVEASAMRAFLAAFT